MEVPTGKGKNQPNGVSAAKIKANASFTGQGGTR
jgi:hypothetical protein